MRKNIIVFAGSEKSRILVDCLNPSVTFWQNEILSKQKYIKCLSDINHINNDIICVNWPYITPESALNHKNIYTIHESLLPNYSGCAPVNWSIIEGSSLFGVTLFRQTKVVDAGDILFQDGFYSPREGASVIFNKLEHCYKKCADFIHNNVLSNCPALSDFGIRTYFKKRKPIDNIVEYGFDPQKLVNLFLSTTLDYPLIYIWNGANFKIYAIKVFGKFINYYPLGELLNDMVEIKLYNNSFVLIGVKING